MNSLWVSLRFFALILVELTVLFLGISTLVGLVFEYLSNETLRRWLSRKGWLGNFLGAALGAVTPFCSCSTIPMTVGLLRAGVPFGATMSFVLASPLLNPIILTMLLALLGWKACVAYGAITFVMAMISGSVLAALGLEKDVKTVRISGGPQEREKLPTFDKKLRRAFSGAWGDFRSVLLYLIAGVAIGAAVYGYVPGDFVARIAGPQNPLAIPVAALIGIPLYVRAETVIPIGLALTQKGMSLGAVIALVIGGAGMSVPEMSMLASIFKVRLVAVFIAVVFSTAVLAGFVFNLIG
ncbi:MAG: permease [Candidatus Aminicenantales bacterium]